MKFYQARLLIQTRLDARDIISREALFREFERKLFIAPYQFARGYSWSSSRELSAPESVEGNEDPEADTILLGASVICVDIRTEEEDIVEALAKACAIWDGSRLLDCEICESTFLKSVRPDYEDNIRCNISSRTIAQELDLWDALNLLIHFQRNRVLNDSVVHDRLSLDTGLARARRMACSEALSRELEQLYSHDQQARFLPVHYLIEGETWFEVNEEAELLVSALWTTGRLQSTHIFSFDADYVERVTLTGTYETTVENVTPALGKALQGNVLLIKYGLQDSDDSYGRRSYQVLTQLLEVVRDYLDDTQVIFAVPPNAPELRHRLAKLLGVTLVRIERDRDPSLRETGSGASLERLKSRASYDGLPCGERLERDFRKRLEDASFDDPEEFYDFWKHQEIIERDFPEYREAAAAQRALVESPSAETALQELDGLIGLGPVKQQIRDILARTEMNKRVREAGLPIVPVSLHSVFLGEPGTGKTVVAQLYGRILKEAGILKEGRVITVSGAQPWNVKDTFEYARGSVLFIDEAYGLMPHPGMVTELIALMEARRDDTVVILAGYEAHMNALLDSNPGFRSRIGFVLRFPNYSLEEKLDIFKLMARKAELELAPETESELETVLARFGSRPGQGNARYVRKLFEDAVGAQQLRLARECADEPFDAEKLRLLLPEDIGKADADRMARELGTSRDDGASGREKLERLIGLSEVKKLVAERLDLARIQKARRDAGLQTQAIPLHLAFMGNPGTGKTEVARLIGQILHEEGVLSVGDFFEVGRQDLVSNHVGGTAPQVAALFQKARGSVIFIDEAYSLIDGGPGSFGDEAITALVDQMEKLRDEVVVIIAGYTKEIERLLSLNPGFASRMTARVVFPDYTADELVEIFETMAENSGFKLATGTAERARAVIERAAKLENAGNARFARNLLEDAMLRQGTRLAGESAGRSLGVGADAEALQTLLPEDIDERVLDGLGGTKRTVGFLA